MTSLSACRWFLSSTRPSSSSPRPIASLGDGEHDRSRPGSPGAFCSPRVNRYWPGDGPPVVSFLVASSSRSCIASRSALRQRPAPRAARSRVARRSTRRQTPHCGTQRPGHGDERAGYAGPHQSGLPLDRVRGRGHEEELWVERGAHVTVRTGPSDRSGPVLGRRRHVRTRAHAARLPVRIDRAPPARRSRRRPRW